MRIEQKFKVVEGGVGAGKTTLIRNLTRPIWRGSEFEGLGHLSSDKWVTYYEPGGTSFGELVRSAVQGDHGYEVHPYAALLGYASSRANLIRTKIIPDLENGLNVLLDRYWFSTYAYQGAEGVSKPTLFAVNMIATGGLFPGKVLHLDLLPEIGMARKNRGQASDIDRYDKMELEFHRKVRDNYHQLNKMLPGIWKTIDASRSEREILEEALGYLVE